MTNRTKENHYVPTFYLKSFCKSDGIIYQKDLSNNIIHSHSNLVESACKKKNLYTIKTKISQQDIAFFEGINGYKIGKNEEKFFTILVHFLNDEFASLLQLQFSDKATEEKINEEFKRFFNSDISRNQESLYDEYEKDFQPVYSNILKNGNLNHLTRLDHDDYAFRLHHFLKITQDIFKRFHSSAISKIKNLDKETALKMKNFKPDINISGLKKCNYYDFVYYIISQYFRTLKIYESVKEIIDRQLPEYVAYKELDYSKVNPNNVMCLMAHYQTINITNRLINEGYKLVLIKNCTELNFITSDNPAINTYSYIVKSGRSLKEVEIFFPLSPKLAVLYSKKDNYLDLSTVEVQFMLQISIWNAAIKEGSQRYIYSDSEELVKIH